MPKRDATECLSGSAGAEKCTGRCASLLLEMRQAQRQCFSKQKMGPDTALVIP